MTEPLIDDPFVDPTVHRRGVEIAAWMTDTIRSWQWDSARTQQSRRGVLGFSDLGGCREYIKNMVIGTEWKQTVDQQLKWAAFIGTAAGDKIEEIMAAMHPGTVRTQQTVELDLGDGIVVRGHGDVLLQDAFIDLKSRDTLAEVRRDGPHLKEKVQISGYLVGSVQQGVLPETSTAHLVYYDRSGKEKGFYTGFSISYQDALGYLAKAKQRLADVAAVIAYDPDSGEVTVPDETPWLKDEPASWCENVGCPFVWSCWGSYQPTEKIEHPDEKRRIREFYSVNEEMKEITKLRAAKKEALQGVGGMTDDGEFTVDWKFIDGGGLRADSTRLEVRKLK